MTSDDQALIIKKLKDAEIKTPAFYKTARELFNRILSGDLTFDQAYHQADEIVEPTDRRCALDVLAVSENFLRNEPKSPISRFPRRSITLPNGLPLAVSPIFVRNAQPKRLLVLYFWNTPLSSRQISTVAAVVRMATRAESGYDDADLDFVSASLNSSGQRREFRHLNWAKCKPLSDAELTRFWGLFTAAWERYQRMPPREIKSRRDGGLFD